MSREFRHYIAGELIAGEQIKSVENPATEETCGNYRAYTADMLDHALTSAQIGFRSWSVTPMGERAAWMKRLAQAIEQRRNEVIDTLVAETGKPLVTAEYDYGMLITCLNFFAEEVQRLRGEIIPSTDGVHFHHLVRHPVGVVVGLLAWNFPLLNLGYKIGPALAAGCASVIKPSSVTPLSTALIGEIMASIDFPPGVVNIVLGDDREVAKRLLTSPIPAMITMIGSTEAGCELMRTASTSVKRFSLELGGNAPVIVYPDFDLETAAQRIVDLKLANAGQVCVSPNRCFVHRDQLNDFVAFATQRMAQYRYGAGAGEELRVGPVMTARHLQGLLEKVEYARQQGAQIVHGGARPPQKICPRGHYMEPTLAICDREYELCREEIFGPILPVIAYNDEVDVIEWANDSPYGLASYVFTHDVEKANACAERLEYGSICINEPFYSIELPHGGLKQSGVGKDCSHLSLEEYFSIKRVTIRREKQD